MEYNQPVPPPLKAVPDTPEDSVRGHRTAVPRHRSPTRNDLKPVYALSLAVGLLTATVAILGTVFHATAFPTHDALLCVGTTLFAGLGFVLLFSAICSPCPIDWGGVPVMLAMGMVCFVPFALVLRGTAARPSPRSA